MGSLGLLELAECDERLDMEGLAPIEHRLGQPHRGVQLLHPGQHAVGRHLMVARGKLDEAEDRCWQQSLSSTKVPGTSCSASSISGPSVERARSILPRCASIKER